MASEVPFWCREIAIRGQFFAYDALKLYDQASANFCCALDLTWTIHAPG